MRCKLSALAILLWPLTALSHIATNLHRAKRAKDIGNTCKTVYPTNGKYSVVPNNDLSRMVICSKAFGWICKATRFKCYRGTIIAGTLARVLTEDFRDDYKAIQGKIGADLYDDYTPDRLSLLGALCGRKKHGMDKRKR